MLKRLVWSSVAATLLAISAVVVSVFGTVETVIALGAAAITAAILSSREA